MKQTPSIINVTLLILLSITAYGQTWDVMDYSSYPASHKFTGTYPEQASDSGFPEFSWDKIPRWVAVRSTARMTAEQINSLANNYQLVMLEKANSQGFPTIDEGIIDASTRLKAINPNIKTLFYWNTQLGYMGYASDAEYLANKWAWTKHTTDSLGNEILWLHKDYIYWYNHNVTAMRNWWLAEALKMARHPMIDGVFLDKNFGDYATLYNANGNPNDHYTDMLVKLNDSVPEGKLIVGNTLRNERDNGSRAWMEISDGSYLERWSMFNRNVSGQTEADAICVSIQLMREALLKGKMINFQTGPGETGGEAPASYEDKLVYMQKNVYYPLAIFLIVAEKYAYFSYTSGVNAHPTSSNDVYDASFIKEFSYKLGAPISEPVKNGYEYSRSYENVDVWVNVQTKETRFDWKELPPIPAITPPVNNLAMNGVATQSSTAYDGDPSRAIDGNTNGTYSNASVTHTEAETNPWWQVDLGGEYNIGAISIFGRTDACCADRLSDYTVSVIDATGSTTFSETFTTFPSVSTDAGDVRGKIIKVTLNATSALSLAEVQVFGVLDTLTLMVRDSISGNSLSDVQISFNNNSYLIGERGEIVFCLPRNQYLFEFAKQGYDTLYQSVDFNGDTTVNVQLSEESPFQIQFKLIDATSGDILPGKTILVNHSYYTSNSDGMVMISLDRGSYIYSTANTGYQNIEGTLDVSKDTQITLALMKSRFNIDFLIKDAATNMTIQGASIVINESIYPCNELGETTVNLEYGPYNYTVLKDGYFQKDGVLLLTRDMDKIILLTPDVNGFHETNLVDFKLYPNPVESTVYIDIPNNGTSEYQLLSLTGETLQAGPLQLGKNTLDMSRLTPGIYLIRVVCNDGIATKRIVKNP